MRSIQSLTIQQQVAAYSSCKNTELANVVTMEESQPKPNISMYGYVETVCAAHWFRLPYCSPPEEPAPKPKA